MSPGSFDRVCTEDLQIPLADLPILLVNRELRHFFLMADDRQVARFICHRHLSETCGLLT